MPGRPQDRGTRGARSTAGQQPSPDPQRSSPVGGQYERIVFTNALDSEWRPASPAPVAMTTEIVLRAHPEGTDYRVVVRHGEPAARKRHEDLGFADGWGTTVAQLARLVEGR
ncbi:SRPBCC domain-containing protein [Amycolatopsis sulphurea]